MIWDDYDSQKVGIWGDYDSQKVGTVGFSSHSSAGGTITAGLNKQEIRVDDVYGLRDELTNLNDSISLYKNQLISTEVKSAETAVLIQNIEYSIIDIKERLNYLYNYMPYLVKLQEADDLYISNAIKTQILESVRKIFIEQSKFFNDHRGICSLYEVDNRVMVKLTYGEYDLGQMPQSDSLDEARTLIETSNELVDEFISNLSIIDKIKLRMFGLTKLWIQSHK